MEYKGKWLLDPLYVDVNRGRPHQIWVRRSSHFQLRAAIEVVFDAISASQTRKFGSVTSLKICKNEKSDVGAPMKVTVTPGRTSN